MKCLAFSLEKKKKEKKKKTYMIDYQNSCRLLDQLENQ